ncbi:SHOCT domain-containing protein [Winogradskyella wichelsiae]|uniref:SHOCT domain-containing protein n=1 Tax=Winogradskyella wichelsiae TaxID=2697007 RepID=UPI003EF41A3F
MDSRIGVGIIIGITIGTTSLIWKSENFTYSQKVFLTFCFLFPPAQWILAIIIYFYNTSNKPSLKFGYQPSTNDRNSTTDTEKLKISTDEQRDSIQILKDKGILSESEFQKKIEIIDEKTILEELYESSEYLSLKKLYDSEILNQDEFDQKIQAIKNKIKADKKTIELNNQDDTNYENVGIEPIYVTDKYNDGIGWWFLLYLIIPLIGLIMMIVYFSKNKNRKGREALFSAIIGIILNLIISAIFN